MGQICAKWLNSVREGRGKIQEKTKGYIHNINTITRTTHKRAIISHIILTLLIYRAVFDIELNRLFL